MFNLKVQRSTFNAQPLFDYMLTDIIVVAVKVIHLVPGFYCVSCGGSVAAPITTAGARTNGYLPYGISADPRRRTSLPHRHWQRALFRVLPVDF